MSTTTYSGRKMTVYSGVRGTLVEGNGIAALTPNTIYEVYSVAPTGSALPVELETALFKSPGVGTDLTLATGDKVYPIIQTELCRTETDISLEEGTIESTDSCSGGYTSTILDGYVNISGSINGYNKFDVATQTVVDSRVDLINLFMDVTTDDGEGTYTYAPKINHTIILDIDLNNTAGVGDTRNSLLVPAIFTSLGTGAGLQDIQKFDLSWTKGEGLATFYKRVLTTEEVA